MNPVKFLLIALVQFYRWFISPLKNALFGPAGRCRYTPSCSAYALEAIRRHGAIQGTWLAVCRLGRCHPWAPSGPDPVPEHLGCRGRASENVGLSGKPKASSSST